MASEWDGVRECASGCLYTTHGGMHAGPCLTLTPKLPDPIGFVRERPAVPCEPAPVETWSQYWERMAPEINDRALCPDCGCASSVARGCRSDWHQRPGKFTMAALAGRRAGKSTAYLMAQQRLLQYYAPEQVRVYDHATVFNAQPWVADVDATFENEFTMNKEGPK